MKELKACQFEKTQMLGLQMNDYDKKLVNIFYSVQVRENPWKKMAFWQIFLHI